MFKFRPLQLSLLLFLVLTSQGSAQFAHTDHKQIVDAAGKPLLVRATNLVNWLVPEGYMWLLDGGPQSPGEIHGCCLSSWDLKGRPYSGRNHENYITREDVALLHRAGFSAIRVPLHRTAATTSNSCFQSSFAMVRSITIASSIKDKEKKGN